LLLVITQTEGSAGTGAPHVHRSFPAQGQDVVETSGHLLHPHIRQSADQLGSVIVALLVLPQSQISIASAAEKTARLGDQNGESVASTFPVLVFARKCFSLVFSFLLLMQTQC